MKIYRIVPALAALMAVAACSQLSATQIELTTNGGFETGDTSGWQYFPTGSSSFNVTNDAAPGSTFAAELFNNAPGSAAVIKQANLGIGQVSPGDTVSISFYAKGSGADGGVSFAEFFSELDGGGTSANEILFGGGPLALTNEYQLFQTTAIAGPDVSGGVTLQLTATTGAIQGSTQVLFLDNVSVSIEGTPIPEPASVILAGVGLLGVVGVARYRRRS